MSGHISHGPVMPRCRQSLVIPLSICESRPAWIDTEDGDSISGVAEDGSLIPVAVFVDREIFARQQEAQLEYHRRRSEELPLPRPRRWWMALTGGGGGTELRDPLLSASFEDLLRVIVEREERERRGKQRNERRKKMKQLGTELWAHRPKPATWCLETLEWAHKRFWDLKIRYGRDPLPGPQIDDELIENFVNLLYFVEDHVEKDERTEARRDGWRQLRSKLGLGSETTSSSGMAKNTRNGFRHLWWRRSATKTPPGTPSDPSEEELDEPIIPAVIRIKDGPAPEPENRKKSKWWRQLKQSKFKSNFAGDHEAGPAWYTEEAQDLHQPDVEIPCGEWGWDVDRYFAGWEDNDEEIPGLKVPFDEIPEDEDDEYDDDDEEEEKAPVITVIPANQRWIPLWARKVNYDHVSVYEDDDDDDDDPASFPIPRALGYGSYPRSMGLLPNGEPDRKDQHKAKALSIRSANIDMVEHPTDTAGTTSATPITDDHAVVADTEKAVIASEAEEAENERSVRRIQSIIDEILAWAFNRLDVDTITDKLQVEVTPPEGVPPLPSPDTAMTLVEELDAILPNELGSSPSNDPAPTAAIPSVEILPVTKEPSISDALSEANSGTSVRSSLKVTQLKQSTCIKIKQVSTYSKSFNATAYLARIRFEARQAALLAKPSTPSTVKAVFEKDPDAIVPHDWLYRSSTYAAASTSAFLDAVLTKEAAEPATIINERTTLNTHTATDDEGASITGVLNAETDRTGNDESQSSTVLPAPLMRSAIRSIVEEMGDTVAATAPSPVKAMPEDNVGAGVTSAALGAEGVAGNKQRNLAQPPVTVSEEPLTRPTAAFPSVKHVENDVPFIEVFSETDSNRSGQSTLEDLCKESFEMPFDSEAYLKTVCDEARPAALLDIPSTNVFEPATSDFFSTNNRVKEKPDVTLPEKSISSLTYEPSTSRTEADSSKVSQMKLCIHESVSETTSGDCGRLTIVDVTEGTCGSGKRDVISENTFPANTQCKADIYLAKVCSETRHVALLAQPSTARTVQAVFEDPDAIVPHGWIYGSSSNQAPPSTLTFHDAILNASTNTVAAKPSSITTTIQPNAESPSNSSKTTACSSESFKKETCIAKPVSETTSHGCGRSALEDVADVTCREREVHISEDALAAKSSFNADTYLTKVRSEARHVALLAQPSTARTVKAVFEDPDAIVPHGWIYGSNSYQAPLSTSMFHDVILNAATNAVAAESATITPTTPETTPTNNSDNISSAPRPKLGERYREWERRMSNRILGASSWCARTLQRAMRGSR
ncbi:hypothetical protein HDU96_001104, partial [Phlyctochytrium bullatum]